MLPKCNSFGVLLIVGLVATTTVTTVAAAAFNYEGYKIYETVPTQKTESDFLNELAEQTEEIDFFALTKLPNIAARAMVSPKMQSQFENALNNHGMKYEIINSDVSESIAIEKAQNTMMRSLRSKVGFTQFHRFHEVNEWLADLAKKYSNRVQVQTVGKSHEGRDIKTIRITNGDLRNAKKVIFLDAGIHAREWIAPASALYVIHQLVENFEQNQNLLKDYDWIVLPVVNPDGYEYTHTDSRLWRKTRKPVNSMCAGTDGNRNFGFHWGEVGASSSACSETYMGQTAFSEPETQIVRDILHSLTGRGKMYLTLHSYGNYILYPWGYTSQLPANVKDLNEVSMAGANAMKAATGARYTVGSSTNVLYAAAGGSDDYALAKGKFPISITMELPGGGSGFDPKPSQIKPFVEETWIGIKAMAQKVQQKY